MTCAPSWSLKWLQDLKFDWIQVQLTFRLVSVTPVFGSTAQLGIKWLLKWGRVQGHWNNRISLINVVSKNMTWKLNTAPKWPQMDFLKVENSNHVFRRSKWSPNSYRRCKMPRSSLLLLLQKPLWQYNKFGKTKCSSCMVRLQRWTWKGILTIQYALVRNMRWQLGLKKVI